MPGPIQSGISSALTTAAIVAGGAKQIQQEEEKAKLEATQKQQEVANEMADKTELATKDLSKDIAKAQEKYHVKSDEELAEDSLKLFDAGEQELAYDFLDAAYDFNAIAYGKSQQRLNALRNSPGWKIREAFLNAPANRKELNNYLLQLSQHEVDKSKEMTKQIDENTRTYGYGGKR